MRIKNKDWKPLFTKEQKKYQENFQLPDNLMKIIRDNNVFRSGYGEWFTDMVYYKGDDVKNATAWAFVMDDGGYYKVFAKYAFWHTNCNGNFVLQCCWSYRHLKKTLRNYLETGKTLFDPNYQT